MRNNLNPTTKEILKILGIGAIVTVSFVAPNLPIALGFIAKEWKKYRQKDLGHTIRRFIKQDVVSIYEEDGQQAIQLTEKGKNRLLKYNFDELEIKARKRDGLFRVVIFDIPEDLKKNRELFRKKLTELGFIRMQDSVFVSAFPCKDEIDFVCHFLEISRFVTLFSVNKIERGEELVFKKYWNPED